MSGLSETVCSPPTRARVVARGLVGLAFPTLATAALLRAFGPLAWLYPALFAIHWLLWYPRVLCRHCAHYGRVCPSWGGKISALFYDRPQDRADPVAFARRKRLGLLAGVGLRAVALCLVAVPLSGPSRTELWPWLAGAALFGLGVSEASLYIGSICRGCRMSQHCPASWAIAPLPPAHRRNPA